MEILLWCVLIVVSIWAVGAICLAVLIAYVDMKWIDKQNEASKGVYLNDE